MPGTPLEERRSPGSFGARSISVSTALRASGGPPDRPSLRRRALLRRFPFCLFYQVERDRVVVHGCFIGSARRASSRRSQQLVASWYACPWRIPPPPPSKAVTQWLVLHRKHAPFSFHTIRDGTSLAPAGRLAAMATENPRAEDRLRSDLRDVTAELVQTMLSILVRTQEQPPQVLEGWRMLSEQEDSTLDTLCSRAATLLKARVQLRHPRDVLNIIADVLSSPGYIDTVADCLLSPSDYALSDAVAERLLNPYRDYAFSVPIGRPSPVGVQLITNGGLSLRHVTAPQSGLHQHTLSGTVSEVSPLHGVIAIQRVLEEVAGITLGLRMASVILDEPTPAAGQLQNVVSVELRSHVGATTWQLTREFASLIHSILFVPPQDLSEIELRGAAHAEGTLVDPRHLRIIDAVLSADNERATELRAGARNLLRAARDNDPGLAFSYAFMCMEGLLLEGTNKESVTARLYEAVAYRVGTSSADRNEIRKHLRNYYGLRSQYVHTGRLSSVWNEREGCVALARRVLAAELTDFASA